MNVLLVEDERRVADFIRRGLKAEGWTVTLAADGETALDVAEDDAFDVIVLDLMLPGISGQDVCRRLRARGSRTPVLMLTALDKVDERVAGLRIGADDYLPKPFDFEELLARIEALRRRASHFGEAEQVGAHLFHNGALSFDSRSLEFTLGDRRVELSAKEREILQLLITDPGRVFSRERILNAVWGVTADPLTNIVDVYISWLRKKLGDEAPIETVRGAGYRLGNR